MNRKLAKQLLCPSKGVIFKLIILASQACSDSYGDVSLRPVGDLRNALSNVVRWNFSLTLITQPFRRHLRSVNIKNGLCSRGNEFAFYKVDVSMVSMVLGSLYFTRTLWPVL